MTVPLVSDTCLDWLGTKSRNSCDGRDLTNIIEVNLTDHLAAFLFDHQHQLKPGRVVTADVPAGQNDVKFEIREGDNINRKQ